MGNTFETLKVTKKRWADAQEFEGNLWMQHNRRNPCMKMLAKFVKFMRYPRRFLNYLRCRDFLCGDDWNYWWMEQFDRYKTLPKYCEKALEVGCGPYTNTRLISKICNIKEIHCCDPLMDVYKSFRLTWLTRQYAKNKIKIYNDKCEDLRFENASFDIVICINVLDHVQNAPQCLNEIIRVTKQGGCIILGQDLSDEEDLSNEMIRNDVGHPIKIHHAVLDRTFGDSFEPLLKKILPRDKGRNPDAHYGTYIYIGQKICNNHRCSA